MLTDKKVKAFALAIDATEAKRFYGETLGFSLNSEDDYGIEFQMNDALLRVAIGKPEQVQPQKHTILGWCVPDIEKTLLFLKGRGVIFVKYDFLQQDENLIWSAPNGAKVAWFKDPSGNLLSIDQQP